MIDVRTIYKVREDDGVNVLPVTNVPGLVSVAEVVQTEESTEPGGENVLEVRLTDGTTTEFSVYNGSYAGPEGSIEVVNNLTTDSASKALSAAQGKALKDMIDDIDVDIPIVNDLTTGGEGNALSAEMGKVLNGEINGNDVDYATQWNAQSGYYNSPSIGNTYTLSEGVPVISSSSSWRCYYIPVTAEKKYIISGTGGSNNTVLWTFTDSSFKVLSKSGNNITATDIEITAPANGYLFVNADRGSSKKLVDHTDGITDRVAEIERHDFVEASDLSDIATNETTSYDLSAGYVYNGPVGSTATTTPTVSSDWMHAIIQVSKGDKFNVSLSTSGGGANRIRDWAFCDADYLVLQCGGAYGESFTGILTAPKDGYLIINGGPRTTIIKLSNAVILEGKVNDNSNAIEAIKEIFGSSEQNMSNYNLNSREDGADNMVWTWWYYPQAITLGDRKRPLLFGYTDSNRKTGVAKYCGDMIQKRPLKYFNHASYDDHSACALLEMQDGRIMYVSDGNHGRTNYLHIRISNNEGSIDGFGTDVAIEAAVNGCSYAQVLYMAGLYYIFYRDGTANPSNWRCVTSSDGETWSSPMDVVNATYQYYCLFRPVTDDQNSIRILMYSNPTMGDTNIRQGFIDVSTSKIYDADGTTELGEIGDGVSNTSFTTIIPEPGGAYSRMLDTAITAKANPCVSYCIYSTLTSAATYYVYKDGESHQLCVDDAPFYTGSGYHGGVAFVGTDKAVVSRYDEDTDEDVIEVYELTNYTMSKELNRYNTHGLVFREVRPIVDADGLFVVTQQGYYLKTSYSKFYMNAKVYEL